MTNNRLKYIDIAKGIGIFLVIWGHLIPDGFIDDVIYSFHMPLFLFLSGYMLRMKSVELNGTFVKKRIKQLMLPYFAFSAVYLIWELLVNRESLVGMAYMTYQTVTFRGMAPLWFLASLFFAELFYLCLMKWSKKAAVVTMLALCLAHVILGRYIDLSGISGVVSNPMLFLVRTSLCVPFLACGYGVCGILQKKQLEKHCRMRWILCTCAMLTICVSLVVVVNLDVNVHLYDFSNVGAFVVAAVTGSVGVLALSISVKENRILEQLGKNSLMLMALHYPITQILKNYIRTSSRAVSTMVSFIATVLLIAVLYILLVLFRKIFTMSCLKIKQKGV